MKIIHLVLGKANPLRMNGVNKLVHEMVSSQSDLGIDVQLWGITKNPVHDYPERVYDTVLFPSVFNKAKLDSSLKEAIQKLEKPVVFHLHGSFIPEFYYISQLLIKRRIQYIYTPHGALAPAALKRSRWKKKWYFELFEKKLIQSAGSVITTGLSVYENLDNLVSINNKILIPNGQPKLYFKAEKFDKSQPMAFGYCGRIAIEHKGLDLLLEGFKIFLNKGGIAFLHLIGDGQEMPKLKKIANKLNLANHICYHGAKFGDKKFKLLCKTNVFVHTSRMEGFPAAVLEAAALGLPCLVSVHTNVGDYIKKYNCGVVIENNTPQFIAEKMLEIQLLHDKGQLQVLGEHAIEMIEKEFDWKIINQRIVEVYESRLKVSHKLV